MLTSLNRPPDVSTLMPVWNTPPAFMQRAVMSACTQVGFDKDGSLSHELIVIDDASDDPDTLDYLDGLQNIGRLHGTQILVLRLNERRGCGGARNAGLGLATGDYLALLDADDNWYSSSLVARWNRLNKSYAHFVYGMFVERVIHRSTGMELVQRAPRGRDIFDQKLTRALTPEEMKARILDHNIMAVFAMMTRRSLVLQVGGFEEPVICSEDWLCWRRIFELPDIKIEFLDEPLGNYNMYYPEGVLNNHRRLDPNFDGAFHLNTEHPDGKAGQYLDGAAAARAARWKNRHELAAARWKI
jgi:glycosyltransferase involved in cell wall biosynthesis